MARLNWLDWTALVLVVVGAINWGLVGLLGFDLVGAIFGGSTSTLSRLIFTIVGFAGLWTVYTLTKISNNQSMINRGQRPGPGVKRAA